MPKYVIREEGRPDDNPLDWATAMIMMSDGPRFQARLVTILLEKGILTPEEFVELVGFRRDVAELFHAVDGEERT